MYLREHLKLMTRGAIAASGAGGLLGLTGAGVLIAEGTKDASGWIVLAGGFAILFLAQIWAVQRVIQERESRTGTSASITGIELGEGASVAGLNVSGNLQTIESAPPGNRPAKFSRWRRDLDPDTRERLVAQGKDLAARLLSFAANRQREQPMAPYVPADATKEQMHDAYSASNNDNVRYLRETHAQFHEQFIADITAWLDEAAEYVEIPRQLAPRFYLMLTGPTPIPELAGSISVLASRLQRHRPRWWHWRERRRWSRSQ